MSQEDLLARILRLLEEREVEYFLTGSLVSSMQGEPRATHDIDFVIEDRVPLVADLQAACQAPRFYLDEIAAREAMAARSSFNLIDSEEGLKVDFWLLDGKAYDRSRIARRVRTTVPVGACWVSSPEDTILIKLVWCNRSGFSEKQFWDALRVFEVQSRTLDLAYLELWADRLGVRELWNRLKGEAKPL